MSPREKGDPRFVSELSFLFESARSDEAGIPLRSASASLGGMIAVTAGSRMSEAKELVNRPVGAAGQHDLGDGVMMTVGGAVG
jgi:hypothetical protein